jgi:hypothetical protein
MEISETEIKTIMSNVKDLFYSCSILKTEQEIIDTRTRMEYIVDEIILRKRKRGYSTTYILQPKNFGPYIVAKPIHIKKYCEIIK